MVEAVALNLRVASKILHQQQRTSTETKPSSRTQITSALVHFLFLTVLFCHW